MLIDWDNLPPNYRDQREPVRFFLGRRPKRVPQAAWLNIRSWRITARACATITTIVISLRATLVFNLINWTSIHPNANTALRYSIFVAGIAALFATTPVAAMKRYLFTVDKHNGEICLTCGYHLTGLPTEHRCPECGTEYNLDETRETWRKVILSNIKPPRHHKEHTERIT